MVYVVEDVFDVFNGLVNLLLLNLDLLFTAFPQRFCVAQDFLCFSRERRRGFSKGVYSAGMIVIRKDVLCGRIKILVVGLFGSISDRFAG